jgi:tetratricopeptide (TPR) repeat protein
MEVKIEAKNQVIGFYVVKLLLKAINYQPNLEHEFISYRLLFPDCELAVEAQQNSSLTEAAIIGEQIRFPLIDKIKRNFRNISCAIAKQHKFLTITITNAELIDEGSHSFLKILEEQLKESEINLILGKKAEAQDIRYNLSDREESIEQTVLKVGSLSTEDFNFLLAEAHRYINCGDAWTAERILKRLEASENTSLVHKVHRLLGLAYGILRRTIEAEFYLEKCRQSGKAIDLVHSNYALAMLYARHHPKYLHSTARATEYLEEAYRVLQQQTENDIPNIDYERIFNRNGYALILVRMGRTDEAVEFLKQGIASLSDRQQHIHMHKTVLIYNLAQCYKILGDVQSAISTYQILRKLDPKFPENHMELARCYIETGDYLAAIASLKEAQKLDPSITEIYSLQAFCWQEQGVLASSIDSYRMAYLCEPRRSDICYDYAYALAEQGLYEQADRVLESIDLYNVAATIQEDVFSLRAEIILNQTDSEQAIEVLKQGLQVLPHSQKLQDNLALVHSFSRSE